MAKTYAYVKGQIVPEEAAVISIQERGFRLGDGIFETIRVVGKNFYALPLHTTRLRHGLHALKIKETSELEELPAILKELIDANGLIDGMIRLSVTRGIGSEGYLPTPGMPTWVIQVSFGLPVVESSMELWYTPDIQSYGLPYKSMQSMPYILSRMVAHQHGCFDALLCRGKGVLAETSSATLFWVKDSVLHTPALEVGIIDGVIRRRVIELSPYPVKEDRYNLEAIYHADEVFVTNASWLLRPVKSIRNVKEDLSFGSLGPVTHALLQLLHRDMSAV